MKKKKKKWKTCRMGGMGARASGPGGGEISEAGPAKLRSHEPGGALGPI